MFSIFQTRYKLFLYHFALIPVLSTQIVLLLVLFVDNYLIIKHFFVHLRLDHLPFSVIFILPLPEEHCTSMCYNNYYQRQYIMTTATRPWLLYFNLIHRILGRGYRISFYYLHFELSIVQFNMILDSVLLVSIFVGLHLIKTQYPNFLFFPKGAALFLPPDLNAQVKPKKKKEKIEQEVSVIKIEYEHVKEYPFTNQFSRVQTTTVGLTLFFAIRFILTFIIPDESLFPFYTTCLILIYTIKLGIDTFFMTNYGRKNCFIVALTINAIFYFFFVGFEGSEGVFDQRLKMVVADFIKHLQIVFNREITFFTHRTVLITVFILNFFIVVAAIPAVIKFGNWYAKTLKETSYQEEEQTISTVKREGMEERDIKAQEQRLREESKKIIYQLNVYLAFMLAVQFFSHRFITTLLDESLVFFIRAICLAICVFIICSTMSNAIEFNGSFAYKYVLQFFQTEDAEKRAELRKKVAPYIYYIWYHYFQFLFRIIVPLLLFLIVVNWKYLSFQKNIINGSIAARELNGDIQCPLYTDQLSILENLYKCPINASTSKLEEKFFLSGIIESIPKNLLSNVVQSNIQKYGLVTKEIMIEFWEQLFWYSSLSIYLMTVFYILFLRKTVYDI